MPQVRQVGRSGVSRRTRPLKILAAGPQPRQAGPGSGPSPTCGCRKLGAGRDQRIHKPQDPRWSPTRRVDPSVGCSQPVDRRHGRPTTFALNLSLSVVGSGSSRTASPYCGARQNSVTRPKFSDLGWAIWLLTWAFAVIGGAVTGYYRCSGIVPPSRSKARRCTVVGRASWSKVAAVPGRRSPGGQLRAARSGISRTCWLGPSS